MTRTIRIMRAMIMALLLITASPCLSADFVLQGVVSDVNGRPAAGAEVALYLTQNVKKPADFASKQTAADGAYTVTVPEGRYWAVAVLRKGEKRFGPLDLGDKHSGEAVEVVVGPEAELKHDFTVMDLREAAKQNQKKNEALLRLSGRILGPDGKPVAMAFAMADKGQGFKEMPAYVSAWTDDSGAFLLLLPKGRFFVGAATTFPPASDLKLSKEVNLSADTDGVDLALPK